MKKFIDASEIKGYMNPAKYFVKKKPLCVWKVVGIIAAIIAVALAVVAIIKFVKREEYLYGDDYNEDFEDGDVIYASESDFDEV